MNLYQKISAVMKDVQYLTKDDTVDAGKGKSYRAITEEKVTVALRASMIIRGLTIVPIALTTHREDEVVESQYGNKINRITTVEVTYRITDIDKPEDYIDIVSAGTGVDTQDKGIGKALTYAYKYALLRTFAIPTGDDPDKVSSDVYTEKLFGTKSNDDDKSTIIKIIIGLGKTRANLGNTDAENAEADRRTRAFAAAVAKKYNFSSDTLESMTVDELKKVKVEIAKKNEASGK